MTKKHSKNNYSDNAMKTIAYIMSTYHIGTHNLDIRDVLKSYIIARYYGWEPKEEDLYTYDYAGGLIINDTTDYLEIYEIEIEDEPFDEFLGNIITYASEKDLFENLRENLIRMDLTKGADDQYYDYSPSQVEAILFGILQLTPEHQDIIVIDLKKHLKSFIQDKDQAEEMITQYTCYYNAIKRWESNHKETEILHQLEISNLLEQLKNN